MITLNSAVALVLMVLAAALIFGLLAFLIHYAGKEWPAVQPYTKVAHFALVVVAVLVAIAFLLGLVNGTPVVRW
jgi:hypothetical protein